MSFAILKRELARIHPTKTWPTRTDLAEMLGDYIEDFYDPPDSNKGSGEPPLLTAEKQDFLSRGRVPAETRHARRTSTSTHPRPPSLSP